MYRIIKLNINCIMTLCPAQAGIEMREPGGNPGHCQNAVCTRGCFSVAQAGHWGIPEKAGEQARDQGSHIV